MNIVNLDYTGVLPANTVTGDLITVTPDTLNAYGVIFPEGAPYFAATLKMTYTDKDGISRILEQGIDYDPIYHLPCVGNQGGVYGGVRLYDSTLDGTISLAYNRLGGSWSFNKSAILAYLNSNEYDDSLMVIVLTPTVPLLLNGVEWRIEGVKGITVAQNNFDVVDLSIVYQHKDPLGTQPDISSSLTYVMVASGKVVIGANGTTPQKGYSIRNIGNAPLLFSESKKTTNLDIGLVHEEIQPGAIYTTPLGYKPVGVVLIGNPNTGMDVKYSLRVW